jgi:hypothetical protein
VTWLVLAVIVLSVLCVFLAVLAAPTILIALLRPALMCADGKSRKPAHIAAGLVAWVADLVAARTTWPLLAGKLQPGEKTISDSLERLVHVRGPNQTLFIVMSHTINHNSPTKRHIPNVPSVVVQALKG